MIKKPVLFLTFNRIDTTKRVFAEIQKAKPPRFYFASDQGRNEEEIKKVKKVRKYVLDNINWDCEVKTLLRDENLGCRNSVSDAITWFFKNEKDGIILEDDCLPNQSFFHFCEELLDYYKDDKRIWHISGDQFVSNFDNGASYYFAKIMHCWGWASWADRWAYYGKDLKDYNESNLQKFSENEKVQKYWLEILTKMKKSEINTWDYQWTFRLIESNGLCINPSKNLISNIGFGEEGTHTVDSNNPFSNLPIYEIKEIIHPKKLEVDKNAVNFIYKNHYNINYEL